MKCPIEESIAIKADEPEQLSAWELYQYLCEWGHIDVNGKVYSYADITHLLYCYEFCNYTDDEITKFYIDKIAELMDE